MNQDPSVRRPTTVLLETPAARLAMCPLCHTEHKWLSEDAVQGGDSWQCARCGQQWNAGRLATKAAYAAWVAEHEAVSTSNVAATR